MYAFVARQAIFDHDANVFGYELLFRDGEQNCYPDNIDPDEATSKLITGSHLALGVEEITFGKPAFINFHTDTLLYRFPTSLNPQHVFVEIVETVEVNEAMVAACKHIHNLGYQIVLDDHDFSAKWDPLLPFVSYVKVDIESMDISSIKLNLPRLKQAGFKLIAERVETAEQLTSCAELGFDYFQGYFFAKPEVMRNKNIPSSKLVMLELMRATSNKYFDFDEVSSIIERDVAISYMLLRFINNPLVNKRYKINTLKHALNYMGEVEIKKFIALVALANMGQTKSPELIHLSLVRAKFCELLAKTKRQYEDPPTGFLLGLFSMLDALLDQNMDQLMNKIPLDEDLKQALCGRQNELREYLSLARACEFGIWAKIDEHCDVLQLDRNLVNGLFNQAISWGKEMVLALKP